MAKWFNVKKISDTVGELYIYGYITNDVWYEGEVSPDSLQKDLADLGTLKQLNVCINSDGGSVFAGIAIYNILKRHEAHVTTFNEGIVASIASVIFQAGDTRVMPVNTMQFVHSPWTISAGNAADFRRIADDLDKITEPIVLTYLDKAKIDRAEIETLMLNESYMTSAESIAKGFADTTEGGINDIAQASVSGKNITINGMTFNVNRFKNLDLKKFNVVEAPELPQEPEPQEPVDYSEMEMALSDMDVDLISASLVDK